MRSHKARTLEKKTKDSEPLPGHGALTKRVVQGFGVWGFGVPVADNWVPFERGILVYVEICEV